MGERTRGTREELEVKISEGEIDTVLSVTLSDVKLYPLRDYRLPEKHTLELSGGHGVRWTMTI